jgi:hypothetical protein
MADDIKPVEQKAAQPTKTRVRALARGYFGGVIIEAGQQFDISNDGELGSWMEPVNKADSERLAKRLEKLRPNRPPPPISKNVPPTTAIRMR